MDGRINEVIINDKPIKEIDLNIRKVCPSICKIFSENKIGTGFLIKIYKNERELFCLMTNQHIITKEMIELNKVVDISYDCEEKWIQIKLDKTERYIECDEVLDVSIIEIIPSDKIKIKYFLRPNINHNINYVNKEIYILQYPDGENLSSSTGKIKYVNGHELAYDASTKNGSSGSPIFLCNTREVIGIHKQGYLDKSENYGILIHSIIASLQNKQNTFINFNNSFNQPEIPLMKEYNPNLEPLDFSSNDFVEEVPQNEFNQNIFFSSNYSSIPQQNVIEHEIVDPNQSINEIGSNFLDSGYNQNKNTQSMMPMGKPKCDIETILIDNENLSKSGYINKEDELFPNNIKTKELNYILVPSINQNYSLDNNYFGSGFKLCTQITEPGRLENGETKINQDTTLIYISVGNIKGLNLFGILDGHGLYGHFISQYCKNYFINAMNNYANQCIKEGINSPEGVYNKLKISNFYFITNLFLGADAEITKLFDCNFSGTTCNLVFQFNKNLVCSNVGDSRAILIYGNDNLNNQGIFRLSIDHRPDNPQELQRILKNGGMVYKYIYKNGVKMGYYRVFKYGQNYPGLTISRAIGDIQAKKCGVITNPEIIEFEVDYNSKYMVICSKGVWDFLTNADIRDIGNPFYLNRDIGSFVSHLVKTSIQCWERNYIFRNDISVVCVYFN